MSGERMGRLPRYLPHALQLGHPGETQTTAGQRGGEL